MLLLAVGILAYLAFQKGGFKLSEKSEEVIIIDNPHLSEQHQKIRTHKPKEDPRSDELILAEMADQFSKPDSPSKEQLKNLGLDEDEAEYYSEVQARHEFDQAVKNVKDWFQILKSSHETYGKVKNIFEGIDSNAVKKEKLDQVMSDDSDADEVYSKMKELFGISSDDVKAFAAKGQKALSDWADFVEEQKKKDDE